MKATYILILTFLMSAVSVSDIKGASWSYPETSQELPYEEGLGTQESPYLITNAQQLANLAYYVNNGKNFKDKYFKLGNDIDLNPGVRFNEDFTYTSSDDTKPQQWTPIGAADRGQHFAGNFDGNGHKISGLYPKVIKAEWYDRILEGGPWSGNDSFYISGLFGAVSGSVISNLTIDNSLLVVDGSIHNKCFAGTYMFIGLIAGRINKGQLINCKNYGHIVAERTNSTVIGGLAGSISGDIRDCENHGNITARIDPEDKYYLSNLIGGIASHANYGTFTNLLNTGEIRNEQGIIDGYYGAANSGGGIAYDINSDGTISNLENRGEILNGSGIAIHIESDIISRLHNSGNVVNGSGIANDARAHLITECTNSGNISADKKYYNSIAGLVRCVCYYGMFGTDSDEHHIEKCWNTGSVTHERSNAAGLFAELDNSSIYDNTNENNWSVEKSFNIGHITSKGKYNEVAGLMLYGPQKLYDCYNAGILSGNITYGLCYTVKELSRCFNYENREYKVELTPEGTIGAGNYVFGSYYSAAFSKIYYLGFQDSSSDDTKMFGTSMTSEEFANGTVLAAFKEGQENSPWYQNATDRYPKLNDIDDTVSAGVDVPVVMPDDDRIYDLSGRYVGTNPDSLKPGIYIINGRKVMVR